MATPKINENCHYVQNDPHKCKIKLEKFHFDILCRLGVIKESLPGGWGGGGIHTPPGEIGLRNYCKVVLMICLFLFVLNFGQVGLHGG